MSISGKILKTIEEEHITPQSKWHFLLKDVFLWGFFGISVIVGALAVDTIIFMLKTYDWDVYVYLDRSPLAHAFFAIPFLWIAVLAIFTVLAYFNFKYTRRGYRHAVYAVVLFTIMASVVLGTILFFAGFDSEVHETLSRQVPFYNDLIYDKYNIWNNPQKGLLGGQVIKEEGEDQFLLKSFKGKIWYVKENDLICGVECPGETLVATGTQLKLIGHEGQDNVFFVETIRPWVKK